MIFHTDSNKQVQEDVFSHKIQKPFQSQWIFNNNDMTQSTTEKDLGLFLATKLDFLGTSKDFFQ